MEKRNIAKIFCKFVALAATNLTNRKFMKIFSVLSNSKLNFYKMRSQSFKVGV